MLRIKELRGARGWSREKLAYTSGVSLSTVIRAERLGVASQRTLLAFADTFEVSIDELFANGDAA